jgi:hypothetical protein
MSNEAADALNTVNVAIRGVIRLREHRNEVIEELTIIVTNGAGPRRTTVPSHS